MVARKVLVEAEETEFPLKLWQFLPALLQLAGKFANGSIAQLHILRTDIGLTVHPPGELDQRFCFTNSTLNALRGKSAWTLQASM